MSRLFRTALAVSLAAMVAGCATSATSRMTSSPPTELLAATTQVDVVELLTTLYPPAHTRLTLSRPAHDALGQALLAALRERGYAIEEPELHGRKSTPQDVATGLIFDYRFAPVQGDALYELVVMVGKTHLSRVYMPDSEGATLVPAGHWARRE